MSERTEHRDTDREPTETPGERQDPPEEYTGYGDVDPEKAEPGEAEALREAGLQPGGPRPEGEAEPEKQREG